MMQANKNSGKVCPLSLSVFVPKFACEKGIDADQLLPDRSRGDQRQVDYCDLPSPRRHSLVVKSQK